MKKTFLAALCILVLALSLHGQSDEITIGVNLSTTGPLAGIGIDSHHLVRDHVEA